MTQTQTINTIDKEEGKGSPSPSSTGTSTKPRLCNECELLNCPQYSISMQEGMDILLLSPYPIDRETKYTTYLSTGRAMLMDVIKDKLQEVPTNKQPKITTSFAVQCAPKTEEDGKRLLASTYTLCAHRVLYQIEVIRPKLVITLGRMPLKTFGVNSKLSDVVGKIKEIKIGDIYIPVLHTYDPIALMMQPGLVPIFSDHIQMALDFISYSKDNLTSLDDKYIRKSLTKPSDIIAELQSNINYINGKSGNVLVALDTETSSLHAEYNDTRLIAITLSVKPNEGFAFPYNHRMRKFSPEDMAEIKARLTELLNLENTFLVMHNAKFDYKWTALKEHIPTDKIQWDTMLVEHLLEEDKQGNYSLKTLGSLHFPETDKYEQDLHTELDIRTKRRKDAYKARLTRYKEKVQALYINYWVNELTEEQRIHKLATWVERGFIKIDVDKTIVKPKLRKLMGKLQMTKAYQTKAFRVLKEVPYEILMEDSDTSILPEPPTAPREANFEDIPVKMLLDYACMDSIITRNLVLIQKKRMDEDISMINSVKKSGNNIRTKSLYYVNSNISVPVCKMLGRMEYRGIMLNRDEIKKYIGSIDESLIIAKEKINEEIGYKINVNSSADLSKYLYKDLKMPIIKYTDKNIPSVDKDVLKQLYDKYDLKVLKYINALKAMTKIRDTYLKNWLEMSEKDGRIHTSFNQHGTSTYRLSSSGPNLQNIPYFLNIPEFEINLNLKKLFIPDEGYEFYDLDISNAEMRILTAYSRDEKLTNAFNAGMDIHCLTAEGISDLSYDAIKANKEDKSSEAYRVRQLGKKIID